MRVESIRKKLSALLMDTSEEHQLECNIIIGEDEAFGLSSLEMPTVISMFQLPSEGIIYFVIEGMNEPVEFDELQKSDIKKIWESLESDTLD